MCLGKSALNFEKSVFNNRTKLEQVKFINDYLKKNNITYDVNILEYNATGKLKAISIEEYDKVKNILDENYTYVVKNVFNSNNNDSVRTELLLYVSIYKQNYNCKLLVYTTNRRFYYDINNFPKKYMKVINSMFDVINLFRI